MLYDRKWDMDAAGKLLLDAADYMDRHGWCTKFFELEDGSVCLVGAIRAVTHPRAAVERDRVLMRLKRHLGTSAIVDWNDAVCQSKEQAVEALRAAAFR